jgi:hypothetical protein
MKRTDTNINSSDALEYMLIGVVYVITILFVMDYVNSEELLPLAIVGGMAGVISYAIFLLFRNGKSLLRISISIAYVIILLVIRVFLFPP